MKWMVVNECQREFTIWQYRYKKSLIFLIVKIYTRKRKPLRKIDLRLRVIEIKIIDAPLAILKEF